MFSYTVNKIEIKISEKNEKTFLFFRNEQAINKIPRQFLWPKER